MRMKLSTSTSKVIKYESDVVLSDKIVRILNHLRSIATLNV